MKKKTTKIIGTTCLVAALATATWVSPSIVLSDDIANTKANTTNNQVYINELTAIEDTVEVKFHNKELFNLIAQQYPDLTTGKLREIEVLSIDTQLTNNDLSDLKYLINLKGLVIKNNFVNLDDLKYNAYLCNLTLDYCSVTNFASLPNSIKTLEIYNTDVTDDKIIAPYETEIIVLSESAFNGLALKNKEALKHFNFSGYNIFDLTSISGCPNLRSIILTTCPNVRNGQVLSEYHDIDIISLDDYAPIWIDKNTIYYLDNIDQVMKEQIIKEVRNLDKIAESLVPFEIPDTEKVSKITRNVMSRVKYDEAILNDEENSAEISAKYNDNPIYYALKGEDGVCVNYACLFTALANRVGLDHYQQRSASHTWNVVKKSSDSEYKGYDTTQLDTQNAILKDENGNPTISDRETLYYLLHEGEDSLYYYNFDTESIPSSDYDGIVEKKDNVDLSYELGYINPNTEERVLERQKVRVTTLGIGVIITEIGLLLNGITSIVKAHKNKKKKLIRLKTLK